VIGTLAKDSLVDKKRREGERRIDSGLQSMERGGNAFLVVATTSRYRD
jgi:hypothetical protein